MTVQDLIRDLERMPQTAEVVLCPRDMCSGGFPEFWPYVVRKETTYGPDDEEQFTGRVEIQLEESNG